MTEIELLKDRVEKAVIHRGSLKPSLEEMKDMDKLIELESKIAESTELENLTVRNTEIKRILQSFVILQTERSLEPLPKYTAEFDPKYSNELGKIEINCNNCKFLMEPHKTYQFSLQELKTGTLLRNNPKGKEFYLNGDQLYTCAFHLRKTLILIADPKKSKCPEFNPDEELSKPFNIHTELLEELARNTQQKDNIIERKNLELRKLTDRAKELKTEIG